MCKCFNLKFLVFGVAFAIGSFIAVANFSVMKTSDNNLSKENLTEVKLIATPISQPEPNFRPDGGFELNLKPSKEFKDFVWLSVITGTGVGYGSGCAPDPCTPPPTPPIEERVNWKPQTPHGLLVTKNEIYEWKVESISVENFSLVTETKKGQSYKFTGHFTSGGIYDKTKPKNTVLLGRLTKIVNKQITAEKDVSFNWFSWDEVDQETYRRKKSVK